MAKNQHIKNSLNGCATDMEKLVSIFLFISDFLSWKIYDIETIHLNVFTFLTLIIAIIIVSYFLRLVHKLVNGKLSEEDIKSLRPYVLVIFFGDSALWFPFNYHITWSFRNPKIKCNVR
jgi:hypothetical protein